MRPCVVPTRTSTCQSSSRSEFGLSCLNWALALRSRPSCCASSASSYAASSPACGARWPSRRLRSGQASCAPEKRGKGAQRRPPCGQRVCEANGSRMTPFRMRALEPHKARIMVQHHPDPGRICVTTGRSGCSPFRASRSSVSMPRAAPPGSRRSIQWRANGLKPLILTNRPVEDDAFLGIARHRPDPRCFLRPGAGHLSGPGAARHLRRCSPKIRRMTSSASTSKQRP